MADLDEKTCFTCHWIIENVSVLLSAENSEVATPIFRTDATIHNEEWHMQLSTHNHVKSAVVSITKKKPVKSKANKLISLPNCELLVIQADGFVLGNFHTVVNQVSRRCVMSEFFIPQIDVFFKQSDKYLPNDTLTICCKIGIFNYRQCYVHTVLYRPKFRWHINSFNESHITNKTWESASHSFTIKCTSGTRKCEKFHIEVFATNDMKVKFVHSKITEMNTNAEVSSFVQDNITNLYNLGSVVPQHIKDNLSLLCEFIVEISAVSYKDSVTVSSSTDQDLLSKTVAEELSSSSEILNEPTNQQISAESKSNTCLPNNLQDGLLRLYREGKFCDATLKTDDATFHVHKNVLSAVSPVFFAMFDSDTVEGQTGVVNTPDLDPDILERMLMFVYTDSVQDLHWEAASKLYYAADKYDIRPLKATCRSVLFAGLSVSNACVALDLADIHQDGELLKTVQEFIKEHDEVLNTVEWNDLEEKNAKLTSKILRELYFKKGKN